MCEFLNDVDGRNVRPGTVGVADRGNLRNDVRFSNDVREGCPGKSFGDIKDKEYVPEA